jgi:hypothetical protein
MRILIIISLILFPLGTLTADEKLQNVWLAAGTVLCSFYYECISVPITMPVSLPCITDTNMGTTYLGPLRITTIDTFEFGMFTSNRPRTESYYLQEHTPCPEQI